MKLRVPIRQGIESSMVSKWPLPYHIFSRIYKTFENNVSILRYKQVIGYTPHHINLFFSQKPCKNIFIDIFRKRSCCCICINRISAESNRNRHFLTCFSPGFKMIGTCFMTLPMHCCCIFIKNLHSVHTDIYASCFRMSCMNHWKSDKTTTIVWPAF